MKILFIITRGMPIGGAQIHVRDLVGRLQEQGHEVQVLLGSEALERNAFTDALAATGIEFHHIPHFIQAIRPLSDLQALLHIRRRVRDFQPDLVSTHSSKAGVLGRVAGIGLGTPVLFTAHGWAFADGVSQNSAKLYRRIEKLLAPLATRIITVSDADNQLALQYGVANPPQITTIHNGMPDIEDKYFAEPGNTPPKLIMIARFQEQKDHPLLFAALRALDKYEWTLDLIGDGPLRSKYETIVRDYGLTERIKFLGERSDVADHLKEAQIFLLVSNWEGFPRSILEAMRAGLPVVASDVGGVRESVLDEETGFLIPRGDEQLLIERLKLVISDASLRRALGGAGRSRYEQYFTFEHMFAKTLDIYNEIRR